MAGNASFKILIAFEAIERFDVIMRPREFAAPAARQLTLESASGNPPGPASRIWGGRGIGNLGQNRFDPHFGGGELKHHEQDPK